VHGTGWLLDLEIERLVGVEVGESCVGLGS